MRNAHTHEIPGFGTVHHSHPGGDQPHEPGDHDDTAHLYEVSRSQFDPERITRQHELTELARKLGLSDWHEPDQQGVSAVVNGHKLDNAGFWGAGGTGSVPGAWQEMWVTIMKESSTGEPVPVAELNLATLLAWASGYRD